MTTIQDFITWYSVKSKKEFDWDVSFVSDFCDDFIDTTYTDDSSNIYRFFNYTEFLNILMSEDNYCIYIYNEEDNTFDRYDDWDDDWFVGYETYYNKEGVKKYRCAVLNEYKYIITNAPELDSDSDSESDGDESSD